MLLGIALLLGRRGFRDLGGGPGSVGGWIGWGWAVFGGTIFAVMGLVTLIKGTGVH
jgi:hypothetical protein